MLDNYKHSVLKQFEYYKQLSEKTFTQLDDESLFKDFDGSNSIAIIVNHMYGNMMSRWTDFFTTDGEKEWRKRDEEFQDVIKTKEQLLEKWNQGWKCLFDALEAINEDNFNEKIYIRNQEHSVVEAVNRQMMHYAYHVGQIVFLGKIFKGQSWDSLSIAKGKSKEYNADKFSKGKHKGHFTDDTK